MQYYFRLQHIMLNRHLTDFGLRPSVGYLLSALLFVGLSLYLFVRTSFAEYFYVFAAGSFVFNLGETGRNDFLKGCFSKADYVKIRLLENLLLAAPFLLLLCYQRCFGSAAALALFSVAAVWLQFERRFNVALPTPFHKHPFEFMVGFRKTFLFVLLAYFLAFMAVWVDNFNLGIFALLLVFLISLSYYGEPENKFYVWVYALGPRAFLFQKMKIALLHATLLALPVTVGLALFFGDRFGIVAGVQGLGYLYLLTILLAKYSAFPGKINLPQSIFIALGLWLPPLLLGILPFFYKQSVKNLQALLA